MDRPFPPDYPRLFQQFCRRRAGDLVCNALKVRVQLFHGLHRGKGIEEEISKGDKEPQSSHSVHEAFSHRLSGCL